MIGVTLTVAIIASILVFLLPPFPAFLVYLATFLWYPSYLSAPLGTIDFTVHRIIILVFYIKLYMMTKLFSRFKFIWLDKVVIIYFVAQLVAGSITTPSLAMLLENRAGRMFDIVLPYFATRLVITDRERYFTFLKAVLMIAAPLAIVGIYQCFSGYNPFGFMIHYSAWARGRPAYPPMSRLGLTRANVVFAHPIMFGLFFAMFSPICAGLLGYVKQNKVLCGVGMFFMALGLFSCVSSGPALAILCSMAFMAFFRYRKSWRVMAISVVVMCAVVEVLSDRHFFEVIDRFTLNSATAWYRSRLIEVAFFEGGMRGHWIAGFGYNADPGWGPIIDTRSYVDIVNHYILVLVRFGLIGFIPFVMMNVEAIKRLRLSDKLASQKGDHWLIWCVGASLFGMYCSFMSVALFEQILTLFYVILAICGVMPAIVAPSKLSLHGRHNVLDSS